ncbi:hypothetical protein [Streptomyces sp. VB1]|uniref:hypothetical protein n=1 Tax=Streptomyces sp. VB1 TaxID=2986803 RepID=UPI0022423269|nr:hypothetical protein [Streptomyces sp. VB1]UZI33064.1 hypothetical protein OH133_35995 [Streptomyces sp. VB1]
MPASRLVQQAREHLDFRRHCLELTGAWSRYDVLGGTAGTGVRPRPAHVRHRERAGHVQGQRPAAELTPQARAGTR